MPFRFISHRRERWKININKFFNHTALSALKQKSGFWAFLNFPSFAKITSCYCVIWHKTKPCPKIFHIYDKLSYLRKIWTVTVLAIAFFNRSGALNLVIRHRRKSWFVIFASFRRLPATSVANWGFAIRCHVFCDNMLYWQKWCRLKTVVCFNSSMYIQYMKEKQGTDGEDWEIRGHHDHCVSKTTTKEFRNNS